MTIQRIKDNLPENIEIKSFEFEIEEEDPSVFKGYASVFCNVDSDGDIVVPGAFSGSIDSRSVDGSSDPDMLVLWQHDPARPIGRPLKVWQDDHGFRFEARLSNTTDGRDMQTLLADRVVKKMSFGFRTLHVDYANDKDNADRLINSYTQATPAQQARMKNEAAKALRTRGYIRFLVELDMWEISPVTFPANENALIDALKARKHANTVAISQQSNQHKPMGEQANKKSALDVLEDIAKLAAVARRILNEPDNDDDDQDESAEPANEQAEQDTQVETEKAAEQPAKANNKDALNALIENFKQSLNKG